jgi:hypothetical protein
LPEKGDFPNKIGQNEKSHVPDTFQLGAIFPFSAFLASRKINKLCVFNNHEYSDSPRLQDSNCFVINGLRRICGIHVPLVFNASGGWRLESHLSGNPTYQELTIDFPRIELGTAVQAAVKSIGSSLVMTNVCS